MEMSTGAWQRASEWLPAEFAAAEAREAEKPVQEPGESGDPESGQPDDEKAAGSEFVPEKPASEDEAAEREDEPATTTEDSEEDSPGPEISSEEKARNGQTEAEGVIRRLQERADRAKNALMASQEKGTETDDRVRAAAAAAAEATRRAVEAAEQRAREAADAAERLAEKVASLTDRLSAQEKEMERLREATPTAEATQPDLAPAPFVSETPKIEPRQEQKEPEPERSEPEPAAKAEPQPEPEPQATEPEPQPEPEPEPEAKVDPEPEASEPEPKHAPAIDLNSASFDQLCRIGLSVKQAARVIGYREQRGGFDSPDDLDQLSGLPPETIETLKRSAGA